MSSNDAPEDKPQYPLDDLLQTLPKNSSFLGRDSFSQDVAYLLIGMGLDKYVELFKTENISLEMIQYLTKEDLEAMGITDSLEINKILGVRRYGTARVMTIPLNPYEDLIIARNLLTHTQFLNEHLHRVTTNVKRARPADYFVTRKYSGADILKIVVKRAVACSNGISKCLHNPAGKEGLIDRMLEKEKMKLPSFLEKELKGTHRLKKEVLYFLTAVGIGSFALLLANALKGYFPHNSL